MKYYTLFSKQLLVSFFQYTQLYYLSVHVFATQLS